MVNEFRISNSRNRITPHRSHQCVVIIITIEKYYTKILLQYIYVCHWGSTHPILIHVYIEQAIQNRCRCNIAVTMPFTVEVSEAPSDWKGHIYIEIGVFLCSVCCSLLSTHRARKEIISRGLLLLHEFQFHQLSNKIAELGIFNLVCGVFRMRSR